MTTEVTTHILQLMDGYVAARKQAFKQHPLHETVRTLRTRFEQIPEVIARPTIEIRASIGMGNWATVPWIALLDTRDTTTTRQGVYVILLFRADMSGFYLTFNQGVTLPMEHLGRSIGRRALRQRAIAIRDRFPELQTLGFDVGSTLDLGTVGELLANLGDSTIAHRFFSRNDITQDDAYLTATNSLLDVYDRYLDEPIALSSDVAGVGSTTTGRSGAR